MCLFLKENGIRIVNCVCVSTKKSLRIPLLLALYKKNKEISFYNFIYIWGVKYLHGKRLSTEAIYDSNESFVTDVSVLLLNVTSHVYR